MGRRRGFHATTWEKETVDRGLSSAERTLGGKKHASERKTGPAASGHAGRGDGAGLRDLIRGSGRKEKGKEEGDALLTRKSKCTHRSEDQKHNGLRKKRKRFESSEEMSVLERPRKASANPLISQKNEPV